MGNAAMIRNPRYVPRSIAPAAGLGLATNIGVGNFMTRKQRQKTFLGSNNMYRSQLTNYRSRMPPAKKPTARKNVGTKGGPKKRKAGRQNPRKALTGVNKQIQQLRKAVNADRSFHTHRRGDSGRVVIATNEACEHDVISPLTPSLIEAFTNNLRYFNPSVPGTLVTADATTATYSHDMKFKNVYAKLHFKNNYLVPVDVKIYLCIAKNDTNSTPIATMESGISDQYTSAQDSNDALVYLTDIERVKEQWKVDCVFDKTLYAGQEGTVTHSTGEFDYDPSHFDEETTIYQKQWKAFTWVVRLDGPLSHDSVNAGTEIGRSRATIDYELLTTVNIEYDAGINLNDYSVDENRTLTFTNGPLCSVSPIPDNIATLGT